MHKVFDILENQRKKTPSPIFDDIENYLETGDKKILTNIHTQGSYTYHGGFWQCESQLAAAVEISEDMQEIDQRLLDVLIRCHYWEKAVERAFKNEKPDGNVFPVVRDAFQRYGEADWAVMQLLFCSVTYLNAASQLNSFARHYLSLSDAELIPLVGNVANEVVSLRVLTNFFCRYAPERIDTLLDWLVLHQPSRLNAKADKSAAYAFMAGNATIIFDCFGDRYLQRVFDIWNDLKGKYIKFASGCELMARYPEKFLEPTKTAARDYIDSFEARPYQWIQVFLMTHLGTEYADLLMQSLRGDHYYGKKNETLQAALDTFGPDGAEPFVMAALKNSNRLAALETLVAAKLSQYDALVEKALREDMRKDDDNLQTRMSMAANWKPQLFVETFWEFLKHKSKPVRELAARYVGIAGDVDMERVSKLLTDKKPANRELAVAILATANDDAAVKLLESQVDSETSDDVRDKILYALESAWEKRGIKITMKTIQKRMERAAEQVGKFACKWLDVKTLPPLVAEKKKLDEQAMRYLLYRQSRCKEMRADIEAKPLFERIDRTTSGDFALYVLQSFLASPKQEAGDRWALAVAGLLGDDRIVPLLAKQLQVWADSSRGKMSEYAVQALALLGTETALTIIGSLIIRYRTKYKNIGTAAAAAFEGIAEQRGVTADELGDSVVPWLGFEPGKTKTWDIGGKIFEVRVGMDFKVIVFDTEKKKKVASLPKAASQEIKDELKELKDALREVVKGQLLRIENMLVSQYRWPVDRWESLYLRHPVLRPFAVRLVWREYDAKGKPLKTFRALEDGTLTDANDDTVKLAKSSRVGIVHPLELTEEQRGQWRQHLADYDIAAPFPQMERSVISPSEDECKSTVAGNWSDTQLNAMTFKGRAEKLGWRRGSVCDGGGIFSYWKSFPEAGVDAFLGVEDMFIGISMDDTITLKDLCFVKTGSVSVEAYCYDEPDTTSSNEKRMLPFGQVPPIVYSEVFGDMKKIAGEKENVFENAGSK